MRSLEKRERKARTKIKMIRKLKEEGISNEKISSILGITEEELSILEKL